MDNIILDVEVPEHFLCPISLQIMSDPVTAITGITYDRESIEQWLHKDTHNTVCPVTKQTLIIHSDQIRPAVCLTPNHTLLRLIQSWWSCAANSVDRTPKLMPLMISKPLILRLIKDIWVPNLRLLSLRKLEGLLAMELELELDLNLETERSNSSGGLLLEAGAGQSLQLFIISCYKEGQKSGLCEALSVLGLLCRVSSNFEDIDHSRTFLIENPDDQIIFIDALTWVLGLVDIDIDIDNHDQNQNQMLNDLKKNTVMVLRYIVHKASSNVIQRLKPDFFHRIIIQLHTKGISRGGMNAALQVLLDACPYTKNRTNMIEANAVFHLVEIGLETWEKKTTELILGIVAHMCSFADGRAQFLSHAGGVAMVAERLLKVSPAVDHKAVMILALICKFAGTGQVLNEMVNVKAVTKLCMILQADSTAYCKERAKEILRAHSNVWMNSSCIQVTATLLTRNLR